MVIKVADAVAAVLGTFTSEYGVATACLAVGGAAAYFGGTAAYKNYAATQAAAEQEAAQKAVSIYDIQYTSTQFIVHSCSINIHFNLYLDVLA